MHSTLKKVAIATALSLGFMGAAYAVGLSINGQTATSWLLDRFNAAGNYVDSPISVSQSTGVVTMVDGFAPGTVAFASLPACAAGNTGQILVINNAATSPVYNAIAAGGGTVVIPVMCNGTNWTNH